MIKAVDQKLKLVALDEEDLKVISTYLQDAVMRVGDLTYLPNESRFLIALNRFAWENNRKSKKSAASHERRRTAVHFDRVKKVQVKNIRQDAPDAVINLLAVKFESGDAPAGTIELVFSGDGILRLGVECIEAQLSDLGGAWETKSKPSHDLDSE